MSFLLIAFMLVLFAIGMPIAWAMALAASIYMFFIAQVPLDGMVQRMVGGIDSFSLLAIPFFILAANIMNTGGITERLVTFSKVLVGHIAGGLGHVVIVANMLMAGMSGSGVADASGTGTVLIPAMRRAGYQVPFAAALVSASAAIGPIIPPSIILVIYGSIAGVSIGRLLLGGLIPGIVMGLCLMAVVYIIAKKRNYPAEPRPSLKELRRATLEAMPPLGMPVIMLGGMVAGVMTPTEAAVIGAAYAFVLSVFVYRELKLADLFPVIVDSANSTAVIMIIIAASQPFGWMLAFEDLPAHVLSTITQWDLSSGELMIVLMAVILILGCFMEGTAVLVMTTPILLPVLAQAHIDPLHFGVLFAVNIMIGNITPPVGMILYVVCEIGKVSIVEVSKEVWPLILALVAALVIAGYFPQTVTWVPGLLIPYR